MAEIRFIRFRLSLVANPRIGTDPESTTISETSKWSFWCFRVSEHFPSTRILKLLYADNIIFTGRSRFMVKLFQNCRRNDVALSSGIIFVWNRIPFEGRVIDQSEFLFRIALAGRFIRFILFSFMHFFTNKWVANFEMVLFIANITNVSISWTL